MPKLTVAPMAGPRVCLRPLAADDLPLTLAWRNRDDIRRWFVHSDQITWEQHHAWFQRYEQRDNDFLFVIEETARLGQPIGQVSLYQIDWTRRIAEYGRILIGEPAAQGGGYAGEATAVLLAFAFEQWQMREITLEVYGDNERALHVYHHCGFESLEMKDGLLRMRVTPQRFGRSKTANRLREAA